MEPTRDTSHPVPAQSAGQVEATRSTESPSFLVPATPAPARPDPSAYSGPGAAAAGSTKPDITKPGAIDTPFNGALQPTENAAINQGSLLEDVSTTMPDEPLPEPPKPVPVVRIVGISLMAFGLLAALFLGVRIELSKSHTQVARLTPSDQLKAQQLPTASLSKQLGTAQTANAVTVNGQLQVTSSLVLQPSTPTSPAVTGEMYYNSTSNTLAYYNGKQYVSLQGGGNTYTTNVAGNTTNITNVTNVTNVSGGGFTGTGTPGTLAMFDSATTLGNSLITQSGTTLNVGEATGASTTNMQGGTGGVNISTQTVDGSSGAISVVSGGSNSGGAGNVTVDTGPGVVTGTPVGTKTFEGGTDNIAPGFGYSDTLAQSTVQAHGGTHSLSVTVGNDPVNSPNSWSVIDQTPYYGYLVTPGHKYAFSAWVRAGSNASTENFYADFSSTGYLGGGEVAQDLIGTITDATGTWKQVTGIIKAPAGANEVLWEIHATGTAFGEVHYLDDMAITDLNGSTGSSELNLGADNAQSVTLGNDFEVGQTLIKGGSGIALNSGQGNTTVNAEEFDVTSVNGVNVDSGKGNVNITTSASTVVSGSITIQSGNSSTTSSGDVTVDAGAGFVAGTVTSSFTFEDNTNDNVDDWFCDTAVPTNTMARTGTYSLKVTQSNGCGNWGVILNGNNYVMPVTAGHHVFFSAWERAGTTPHLVTGNVQWSGTGGNSPLTPVTDSTSGWTQISVSTVVPAGVTSAIFNLGTTGAPGDVHYIDDITMTDLSSSASTSSVNLGSTNAQIVNIGNLNELGATTISGGSGITMNSGSGPFNLNAGAITISGTAASSIGTSNGSLLLNAGGGTGGGVLVKPQSASSTAFQVQDSTGAATLNVNTTNSQVINDGMVGSAPTGTFNGGASWVSGQYVELDNGGPGLDGEVNYNTSAIGYGFNASFSFWSKTGGGDGTFFYAYGQRIPATYHLGTFYGGGGYSFAYNDTAMGSTAAIYYDGAQLTSAAIPAVDTSTWNNAQVTKVGNVFTMYLNGNSVLTYTDVTSRDLSGTNFGVGGCSCSYNGEHRVKSLVVAGDQFITTGGSMKLGGNVNIAGTLSSAAIETNQISTAGSLTIKPWSNSTTAFAIQNAYDTTLFSVDTTNSIIVVNGNLQANANITVEGHIISGGNTPSIVAGAAACTSPFLVNISGNDTSGIITITAGTSCPPGGNVATVTFANAFGATPHVILTPGNLAAAALNAFVNDSSSSTTQFTIYTNSAMGAGNQYVWNYMALQ